MKILDTLHNRKTKVAQNFNFNQEKTLYKNFHSNQKIRKFTKEKEKKGEEIEKKKSIKKKRIFAKKYSTTQQKEEKIKDKTFFLELQQKNTNHISLIEKNNFAKINFKKEKKNSMEISEKKQKNFKDLNFENFSKKNNEISPSNVINKINENKKNSSFSVKERYKSLTLKKREFFDHKRSFKENNISLVKKKFETNPTSSNIENKEKYSNQKKIRLCIKNGMETDFNLQNISEVFIQDNNFLLYKKNVEVNKDNNYQNFLEEKFETELKKNLDNKVEENDVIDKIKIQKNKNCEKKKFHNISGKKIEKFEHNFFIKNKNKNISFVEKELFGSNKMNKSSAIFLETKQNLKKNNFDLKKDFLKKKMEIQCDQKKEEINKGNNHQKKASNFLIKNEKENSNKINLENCKQNDEKNEEESNLNKNKSENDFLLKQIKKSKKSENKNNIQKEQNSKKKNQSEKIKKSKKKNLFLNKKSSFLVTLANSSKINEINGKISTSPTKKLSLKISNSIKNNNFDNLIFSKKKSIFFEKDKFFKNNIPNFSKITKKKEGDLISCSNVKIFFSKNHFFNKENLKKFDFNTLVKFFKKLENIFSDIQEKNTEELEKIKEKDFLTDIFFEEILENFEKILQDNSQNKLKKFLIQKISFLILIYGNQKCFKKNNIIYRTFFIIIENMYHIFQMVYIFCRYEKIKVNLKKIKNLISSTQKEIISKKIYLIKKNFSNNCKELEKNIKYYFTLLYNKEENEKILSLFENEDLICCQKKLLNFMQFRREINNLKNKFKKKKVETEISITSFFGEDNQPNFIIQPKNQQQEKLIKTPSLKKFSLVLDLDETLVHFEENEEGGQFYVRPHTQEFLQKMSQLYEIVIFTAALKKYANWILDKIDPFNYISHRFYRKHTILHNGIFVKDLSILGRDLHKLIIVDNNSENFILQPDNGILIKSWFTDANDKALLQLMVILENLIKEDPSDCREFLKKVHLKILDKYQIQ